MEQIQNQPNNEQKISIGTEEEAFIHKATNEQPKEPTLQETGIKVVETKQEVHPQQSTSRSTQNQEQQQEVKKEEDSLEGLITKEEDVDIEVRHINGKNTEESKIKDPNYVGEINFPSTTFAKYLEYFAKLPQTRDGMEEYVRKLPAELGATVALNAIADGTTVLNNVFTDSLNSKDNDYVNYFEFGGKKLITRPIDIKTNTKLTQESAIARIHAMLGVGEVVQVPLWHSGFWVTIKPIKQKEFINLYNSLVMSQVRLGRETNSLVFSNYSVVFTRIVVEFIIANITEHSIKLNDDESILDFIKVQDLYPLVNGLISALYPKGLDIVKSCINTTRIDPKSGEPMCDYSVAAKVDSKKLLWVNRKALDKYMISQMCKRTAGSVSTAEVAEYQSRIKKNATTVTSTSETGVKVEVGLKMPTLREYLVQGEKWVNDLISDTERLYTEQDTDQNKITKLQDAILTSRLSTYNTYIDKVTFIDGNGIETAFDKPETIKDALDTISNDQLLFNDILNNIGKFFTNGTIAVIATPNYICPKCKSSQEEIEINKPFKEFIPLNIIENFFALGGLRKEAMTEKGLW